MDNIRNSLLSNKSRWLILAAIFLVIFVTYMASPVITSYDSRWSVHTAVSIIEERNTDLDEYEEKIKEQQLYAIRIIDEHYYCLYPIGTSLIAIPFVYVYDKASSLAIKVIPSLEKYYTKADGQESQWWRLNTANVVGHYAIAEKFVAGILVAAAAVFIYLISRLYLARRYALLIVFIFAFCTPAWSTASRALWQHGPSMLMLSITLYLMLVARKNPRLIQYTSIPLAFSYVIRPTNSIPVVLFTIFVLIRYRQYFLKYILWAMPIAIPFVCFNCMVSHSLLPEYYLPQNTLYYNYTPMTLEYYEAMAGKLISPNRGLFVFSPILLFSIYGIALKIKRKQILLLDYFLIGVIFLHWLIISTIPMFGHQYGPRLFTDMIPYFVYFLIPTVVEFLRPDLPKTVNPA
ncbi:MAG: hypothetical protein PHF74_08085 [Dehalococcoidales bacterium]|nr:hypothetical protein [Dehalococcoidales bacterium]